jgi:hypothetical protein
VRRRVLRVRPTLVLAGAIAASVVAACGVRVGAAPRQPAADAFRVVVISDLNGPYGSASYGAEVGTAVRLVREQWRPDLVLAAGDMIAGQRPTLPDDTVRMMWAAFDSVVAAPLRAAGIPFAFTLGNHDASAYPSHARDRAFATAHWRAPHRTPGIDFVDSTHFPLHYSIRSGPLFVVVWDAASAMTPSDTAMLRWLDAQFTGAAAQAARFRIVLGHLPLYAVAEGRDRPGEVLDGPDMLRALLQRHGVRLYISGHHHAYYPGRRGALELLHAGALGDGPRPLLGAAEPSPRTATILDFDARAGTVRYTTHVIAGDAAADTVPLRSLPRRLQGHNGYVVRRDLRD